MNSDNASTFALIQENVEKLLREGEELAQMKEDIQEFSEFRKRIVHEQFD